MKNFWKMSVSIIVSDEFRRNAKPLIKKYRSLKEELKDLIKELNENPYKGTRIGENIYKIRLAVKSKGRGKSGGMRIITYVRVYTNPDDETINVILLTIYDKSKYESISENYLKNTLNTILEEE